MKRNIFWYILIITLVMGAIGYYVREYNIKVVNDRIHIDLKKNISEFKDTNIGQLANEWPKYQYDGASVYLEKPQNGDYVNIGLQKFRITPNSRSDEFFLFGGSTAFGYGVPDNQTISYYFNELENETRTIRNYGHGGYYSTLEVRHLIDLLVNGKRPKKVVFFHGLNEGKTSPYNEKLIRHLYDSYNYDLSRYFMTGASNNFLVQKLARLITEPKSHDFSNWELWYSEYKINLMIASALSEKFNFDLFVVLQPIPGYSNDFFPHKFSQELSDDFVNYQTAKYNLIKSKSSDLKSMVKYCDLSDAISGFHGTAFVDGTHYAPKVNKLLAKKIFNFINKNDCD